jgi:uncharacterized protein YeaO (DUF488 family)
MIQIKRVYEPFAKCDGQRFLVDRLWPRGIKKESLHMEAWIKEAAPSEKLRQWFDHDRAKWHEFQHRYCVELDANPEPLQPLLEAAAKGNLTLLYSSHDIEHNNAVILKVYLEKQLKSNLRPDSKPSQ